MSIRNRPLRSIGYGLLVVATLATTTVRATRAERDHWFPTVSTPATAPVAPHLVAHAPAAETAHGDKVLDFLDQLRAAHS